MSGKYSKFGRTVKGPVHKFSRVLPITLGIVASLLFPAAVSAEETKELESEVLTWARVDFLRNRVQLVPREESGRRAQISDILSVGDSLRTSRASRAELRFNDGSLARIGERATFRFTPNTRNFQLSNGTILLLIPPGRGRSTIQTPNAVTGIQGSALFVRYIPETDTTIVGALTDNPDGPMVLINRDGTERQALRANEIGVIEGDQITELYQFDGTLFWQSSGLAEGFNYLADPSSTGSDALDGVRQEIREAISNQRPITSGNVIVNPDSFARPETNAPGASGQAEPANDAAATEGNPGTDIPAISDTDSDAAPGEAAEPVLEFEDSPAENYLQGEGPSASAGDLEIGVNNSLAPSTNGDTTTGQGTSTPPATTPTTGAVDDSVDPTPGSTVTESDPTLPTPSDDGDDLIAAPDPSPSNPSGPPTVAGPGSDNDGAGQDDNPGLQPLPPSAFTDDTPDNPDVGPDVNGPDVINSDPGGPVDPGVDAGADPGVGPGADPIDPGAGGLDIDSPGADADPGAGGLDIDGPGVDADPGAGGLDIDSPGVDADPAGPDVGPNADFNDAPAGGSTVPEMILPEEVGPPDETTVPPETPDATPPVINDALILPEEVGPPDEMTVPPETPDATPAVVDDPTLLPVPPQVDQIDELPPTTEDGLPTMTEEPASEMPPEIDNGS